MIYYAFCNLYAGDVVFRKANSRFGGGAVIAMANATEGAKYAELHVDAILRAAYDVSFFASYWR